jgi:hypothetical protein
MDFMSYSTIQFRSVSSFRSNEASSIFAVFRAFDGPFDVRIRFRCPSSDVYRAPVSIDGLVLCEFLFLMGKLISSFVVKRNIFQCHRYGMENSGFDWMVALLIPPTEMTMHSNSTDFHLSLRGSRVLFES